MMIKVKYILTQYLCAHSLSNKRRCFWFFSLSVCFHLLMTVVTAAEENRTPVSIVKPVMSPLYEEIPLSGTVQARRISRISPKVEGSVAEVLVDEGDEVKAGEPLLRLDKIMAEIELSRSQAQLNEAGARLKEAMRQRDEAAELVKKKHISTTSYATTLAEVEINAAILQRLRAELARQEENLIRHAVFAPFAGVVAGKLIEIGQWVQTGTALFELAEIDVLRIDVPVPQHYFGDVMIGTGVLIKFDVLPEVEFSGAVTMKIPVGRENSRTFPVRIELPNKNRVIAPGMSARVRFQLKQIDEVLMLPRDAVVRKSDGSELVWVLIEEDGVIKAIPRSVRTGRASNENLEVIVGDLNAGDRVVVRGNEILRQGQAVSISEEIAFKY